MAPLCFRGAVVLPDRILPDTTVVCEGTGIVAVGGRLPSGCRAIDGAYISPGFIDLHVHGAEGADYMDGTPEAVRIANRAHLRRGTTSIFPTTTTGSTTELDHMLSACAEVRRRWSVQDGARIAGVHFYGPYFAADKVGCHSVEGRRDPEASEYQRFFDLGLIRIATCAAELPGAEDFYRAARRHRCLVTCGHSNATWAEMARGYRAGMRHVDHFWCAMSSVSSLRVRCGTPMQASMEQFALAHPEMSTEVIADGRHLAPELLEFAYRMIGPDRLCLVTDANRAVGMPPGRYRFGPAETGAWFESDGRVGFVAGQGLASSVVGMDHMVRNMKASTSASLAEVIRMASLTPARRAGIARQTGSLEPGKRADVLVLNRHLAVQRVFVGGQEYADVNQSQHKTGESLRPILSRDQKEQHARLDGLEHRFLWSRLISPLRFWHLAHFMSNATISFGSSYRSNSRYSRDSVRRSIIILNSLAITALCSWFLTGCQSRKSQAAGPPPPTPVTVASASTQAAPVEIRVIGSAEPSARVEIKSQVSGQLMSVRFTEGADVKQGDLLFEIDPAQYREALNQAQAAIERDQAQLSQAEFALQRDIVQSKSADAEAARYATLASEHIASQQLELQYRTTAEALKQGIQSDRAAIESAKASLKMDQAQVDQAKLNLDHCEIHAPISGRAGNLLVNHGNLVKANDVPLVVISQITPVFVNFSVPEKHLQAIRDYSRHGKLPVKAAPRDDPGAEVKGYLSVLDNTVDTQTGTIHLKAVFANENRRLWPGQFVNVVLTLNALQNATVIPAEAVQAGQQGQFVYVVKPDKTVEMRIVSLGRTLDNKVIVDKGVQPGENVVTDGHMMLFPGAHVAIAKAQKPVTVE